MQKEKVIACLPAEIMDTTPTTGMGVGHVGHRGAGRSLRVLSLALSALLPLVGCSASQGDGGASDAASESNAAKNTPPIHVSQTSVLLHNGEPAVAKTYREALANCSGDVTPLPDDVVAKLGRTYLETSYEGVRMSVKADRWNFKNADAAAGCHFEPVHESKLTIVEPGAATMVDLTAKTATHQDSPGVVREAVAKGAAAEAASDDDAKMRAAVMAELEKKGQGDLMAQHEGSATIAGQPCVQQKNARSESCIWSGGAKWGFVTDTSATADRMDAPVDSIPLSIKPIDGEGYQLTTESMSVGAPIDSKVFELPSNITVKNGS